MKGICFGDSNTYGYDPRSYFGGHYPKESRWVDLLATKTGWDLCNQGQNGRTIPQMKVFFPADIDLLIVMLGTNDLLQGHTPESTAENMKQFLLRLPLARDKILLIAPPPMVPGAWVDIQKLVDNSHALTGYYRDLAAQLGIAFADAGRWNIPLAYDGVHFTEEGHRAFAAGLWLELTQTLF